MLITQYKVGALLTNCYLLQDIETGKSAIIDPGGISSELSKKISSGGLDVEYIILTHGHFDHIRKAAFYKDKTGAEIVMNAIEKDFLSDASLNLSCRFSGCTIKPFATDILLKDGENLNFGSEKIKMIATPGHTKGSACYLWGENLFTGDTLMKQSIGRTDFETGSYADMTRSLKKIMSLNEDYAIFPGHGDSSSLSFEKQNNLYLKEF